VTANSSENSSRSNSTANAEAITRDILLTAATVAILGSSASDAAVAIGGAHSDKGSSNSVVDEHAIDAMMEALRAAEANAGSSAEQQRQSTDSSAHTSTESTGTSPTEPTAAVTSETDEPAAAVVAAEANSATASTVELPAAGAGDVPLEKDLGVSPLPDDVAPATANIEEVRMR
jgi:hypothetical protein